MRHAQQYLTDVTFIAVDTQTAGLIPLMPRLVDVGAVHFQLDGRELATFQQLIDPQVPIPDEARQVHGIADTMVRGQPTIEHVFPPFIESLGAPDTILLTHNAPFDLGFLAMALTRLGIAHPPYCLFDTLDLVRRLYPVWPSHSLQDVAIGLKVAREAEHRALPDARLIKDVYLALLQHAPTVRKIADLVCLSPPLTCAGAPVFAIEPPAGFEALATGLTERCSIMIMYERGLQMSGARRITPRLALEVHGVAYVVAYCYQRGAERTFRLDRIRRCWLEDEGRCAWRTNHLSESNETQCLCSRHFQSLQGLMYGRVIPNSFASCCCMSAQLDFCPF